VTVNSSSWHKMQVADRDQPFDADDAIKRLFERAAEPGSAFFYRNEQGDPKNKESYRLPFADVIDNKLVLIPHAIYAAAALLSGAHGGLPNIPDKEKQQIRDIISEVYIKLREMFNDPRIRPPWDRGKPPEERSDANMTTIVIEPGEVTTSTASTFHWAMLPSGEMTNFASDSREPYGDVDYADPGYQDDEVKRYPIDTEEHVRAAWSYINQQKNASKYSSEDLEKIRNKIKAAATKLGIEIAEEMAAKDDEECPPGEHKMPDGTCMKDEDMEEGYALLAAGVLRPPGHWFGNPKLTSPTPIQVDDDGRVYGHLAQWGICHVGIGNACVSAPKSRTNYSFFKTGEVVLADGSSMAVGKISLGGGHASPGLGYVPTLEHYDSTSSCVAVVNAGEDRYGIWVAGSVVPGLDETKVAAFRRSPLSGDWRRIGGNLELAAALCVNTPGFPVVRMKDDLQFSLVAAGVINGAVEIIPDTNDEVDEKAKKLEELAAWRRARQWEELMAD